MRLRSPRPPSTTRLGPELPTPPLQRLRADPVTLGELRRRQLARAPSRYPIRPDLSACSTHSQGSYAIFSANSGTRLAERILLFEVVARRYDAQRPVLLSTNKAFTDWGEVFPHAACVVTL